ncbi:hypothetical protein ACFQE5_22405 [Pseudonocardia hispaniensis]|uniref:ATP-grasp target RiPP n=1 Tax=Pseudonocardia hispaniensis TaxID=904933 RepID=A0ABW1J948_9PSEU
MDSPIYRQLSGETLIDVPEYGPAHTVALPPVGYPDPGPELHTYPVAVTAGEQDHSDPWRWAGDEADAPGEV